MRFWCENCNRMTDDGCSECQLYNEVIEAFSDEEEENEDANE